MTNEELEKLLPLAAKAMGYELTGDGYARKPLGDGRYENFPWNPADDAPQCAKMNAALGHNTYWYAYDDLTLVGVGSLYEGLAEVEHNGTRADVMRAWMEASVRAAARVGGRMEVEK